MSGCYTTCIISEMEVLKLEIETTFSDNHVKVEFLADEDELFYAMKDREPIEMALMVRIKDMKTKKVAATYFHRWEENDTFNSNVYNKFIKRFLTDIAFRNALAHEGEEWTGIIEYTSKKGINIKCEKAIHNLNKQKNPKFKDFSQLKTYGMDSFSRMKAEKAIEIIGESKYQQLKTEFDDDKVLLNAMRWTARGLKPDLAVRKVKTDLEIQKNMNKSSSY